MTPRLLLVLCWLCAASALGEITAVDLRTEWLTNPTAVEHQQPRLSWRLESKGRDQHQTAYRIIVATTAEKLGADARDLWDSGKVESDATLGIVYGGRPLASGQPAFWKVRVWDRNGTPSPWSEPGRWAAGILQPADWKAQWISFRDETPLHQNPEELHLPPARYYRKAFTLKKPVRRAVAYVSALGLFDLHINGSLASDGYFAPGWSDYRLRAYYRAIDITAHVKEGENAVGAIVTDGWYSGYVGFGLLLGYGPHKTGRAFYGKTPALLTQLEIEYADETRETFGTDATWQVSDSGPIREADLLMGESYDAARERLDWAQPGGAADWAWNDAIPAEANDSIKAPFFDAMGERQVELGFQAPKQLQPYPAQPVRITQELKVENVTEVAAGVHIFDLEQNFAGNIRLQVKGEAGTKLQIRYGEMLHPDGRLMTENLRKARATDYYTLRGDAEGETWTPRFTYHGFRYVEITGLTEAPAETVTGLVLHNDMPLTSRFECSDEVTNRLFKNVVWTQRSNFLEIPTDCPQRDERLGWLGHAQLYARSATYNSDVAAFFTKWLQDIEEAQRDSGAYADYAPYPMAHGESGQPFGTAWTDAGVIVPWTMWKVYDDRGVVERHWESMQRFMEWRRKAAPDLRGVNIGNPWGDWLNLGEKTPIEYIDICHHALDARLMSEMAAAVEKSEEAAAYLKLFEDIREVFHSEYFSEDGALTVQTQTAHALALAFAIAPKDSAQEVANRLAMMIEENGFRIATGVLGAKALLPVLSAMGHHDLAVRLFQSRKSPSWGYPVTNDATTMWERWDGYTKEDGFGSHSAAMNSFNHYAFGSVCEWMFRFLAGIDQVGSGFQRLIIQPGPPTPGSNPDEKPIDWVKAEYHSVRGPIATEWKLIEENFELKLTIPANASANVYIPAADGERITEGGKPLSEVQGAAFLRMEGKRAVLDVRSGSYSFVAPLK